MTNFFDFNDATPSGAGMHADIGNRAELVCKLKDHLKPILKTLFPKGKLIGGLFFIGDIAGNAGKSLQVTLSDDKEGLWYDFATGEGGDILKLVMEHLDLDWDGATEILVAIDELIESSAGINVDDDIPDVNSSKLASLGKPTHQWHYKNEDGDDIAILFRYDPPNEKKQYRPYDVRKKKWSAPESRQLYNIPGILMSDVVIVVEGEKCADVLIGKGYCATTAMFGANAPIDKSDFSCLKGKTVWIWRDNDEPGMKYAQNFAHASMNAGAKSVALFHLPEGKPSGWDVADAANENPPFDIDGFLMTAPTFKIKLEGEIKIAESLFNGVLWVSDDGLATVYSRQYGDVNLYCNEFGKWMIWLGNRWCDDRVQLVMYQSRHVCRAAAKMADKIATKAKLSSASTIAAVEKIARSDPKHATTSDDWDAAPWMLNTPGGVVDLKTGAIISHDKSYRMTKIATATPAGQCPRWMQFLNEVTDGNDELMQYLQRIIGYCLTGVTDEHALFFLYGTGANGKSIFITVISYLLGDYSNIAPMEMLMQARGERHPTDLAGLRGARFVSSTETEQGARWAESKIKLITGGDPITARFMRQDFFKYVPQFKLVVAGNHKPAIRNVDEAMRRRLHLIPFTVTIPPEKRDKQLLEKLLAERNGIMAWALEGCLAWQQSGLKPPKLVLDATDEYFDDEDSMGLWMSACCELNAAERALTSELFASWSNWAQTNGEYAGTIRKFSDNLISRQFEAIRFSKGLRGFAGIKPISVTSAAFNFNE